VDVLGSPRAGKGHRRKRRVFAGLETGKIMSTFDRGDYCNSPM